MDAASQRVYVSSADDGGPAPGGRDDGTDGVYQLDRDPGSGEISGPVAHTPSPGATFVAATPSGSHLYVTRELEVGGVAAFGVAADGALSSLGWRSTGGSMPCHVTIDQSGRFVLTANYGSGSVSLHPVAADGALDDGGDVVALPGRPSHAHFVWPDPTSDRVVVVDLGGDALLTFALDRTHRRLHLLSVAAAPPGSGPRHLAAPRGDGLVVTGEQTSTVLSFDYDSSSGEARLVDSVPAGGPALPEGNHPSNLMLSPDGRYCFVGVRDADVIATFAVRSGRLSHIEDVATLGRGPRHLAVMGRFVYVVNRDSGTVVTFAFSSQDERLLPTGNIVELPHPCCVLGV